MIDQWMNNRSDPALMLPTNSEEEIVIAQSKNCAHEQAHWRATISSQLQKHEHPPPRLGVQGRPGARFVADPNTIYLTASHASHLIPEIRKE